MEACAAHAFTEAVRCFLVHGQRLGETPLIVGTQRGHREVVVALLEQEGTDVSAANVSPGQPQLYRSSIPLVGPCCMVM